MNAPLRRGYCPSLAAPMQTGDGLLLRLVSPDPGWRPEAVIAIAEAAERYGNGVIQATSRGNLQLRGFSSASVPAFVRALQAADVAEGQLVVACGPLAGSDALEVADPRPIAALIAAGITSQLPPLAPKVSVVVDGGGTLHLDALAADVRLLAADATRWHLFAGPAHLGLVDETAAAPAALALLRRLAMRGRSARMRDLLVHDGIDAICDVLPNLTEAAPPAARPAAEPVSTFRLHTGAALGVAAPFGSIGAPVLAALADAAPPDCFLRPAPGRAILVLGLSHAAAATLRESAGRLGLITHAGDPRRRIAACPGAPHCASAEGPTQPLAGLLAGRPDLLSADDMVHLSGCAKGCAHPGATAITLVCRDGRFALIRGGTANGVPADLLSARDVPRALERLRT